VAGSMSSFSPIDMGAGSSGRPHLGPTADDPRFPSLADFREQAALLAESGVDLIALEMINARGYGHAAMQAAAETGLPVWLGVSPFRLEDGTLVGLPEQGDGESFEALLSALVDPAPAAVTVMHAKPEVTLDAIDKARTSTSASPAVCDPEAAGYPENCHP
jgi:S-methylmethionine-dependent homocysteine/selenocysteine methylase